MTDENTVGAPSGMPVTLRPDGTVWLTIADKRVRLRRPKMKELRSLREQYQSQLDQYAASAEQLRPGQIVWAARETELADAIAAAEEESSEPVDGEHLAAMTAELSKAREDQRNAIRSISDQAEDDRLSWAVGAVNLLTLDRLPPFDDPDDLDAYFATHAFAQALLGHWQTVPLGSGG